MADFAAYVQPGYSLWANNIDPPAVDSPLLELGRRVHAITDRKFQVIASHGDFRYNIEEEMGP